MKKNTTEMVFVLDKSGSMHGLEEDTIGGFNSMIEKQKGQEGEAFVTTILFNEKVDFLQKRINLKDVKEMTKKDYVVSGCTALLDAIGEAISYVESTRSEMKEEEIPEKTIFVITTDGKENSSREYTYASLKSLIELSKKAGYEFLFLGSDIDFEKDARRMGFEDKHMMRSEYTHDGVAKSFDRVCYCLSEMRRDDSDDTKLKIND